MPTRFQPNSVFTTATALSSALSTFPSWTSTETVASTLPLSAFNPTTFATSTVAQSFYSPSNSESVPATVPTYNTLLSLFSDLMSVASPPTSTAVPGPYFRRDAGAVYPPGRGRRDDLVEREAAAETSAALSATSFSMSAFTDPVVIPTNSPTRMPRTKTRSEPTGSTAIDSIPTGTTSGGSGPTDTTTGGSGPTDTTTGGSGPTDTTTGGSGPTGTTEPNTRTKTRNTKTRTEPTGSAPTGSAPTDPTTKHHTGTKTHQPGQTKSCTEGGSGAPTNTRTRSTSTTTETSTVLSGIGPGETGSLTLSAEPTNTGSPSQPTGTKKTGSRTRALPTGTAAV